MLHRFGRVGFAVAWVFVAIGGSTLGAQEFEVLASFAATPAGPSGGLAVGAEGLYGTAGGGAYDYGVVYRFVPPPMTTGGAPSLTMLYSFPDTDAADNLARPAFPPTVASDGSLYGIRGGGQNGGRYASVYRLNDLGEQSLVYRFRSPEECVLPGGPMLDVNGRLYGACGAGGPGAGLVGNIFELSYDGQFKVLHWFFGGSGGANPAVGLVMRPQDGALYGMTANGGEFGEGTIFRIHPVSGEFQTLHSFDPESEGYYPNGELALGPDGALYGALPNTVDNWATCGTIFRLDPDESDDGFSVIHAFSCEEHEPKQPIGGMIVAEGSLFGVTDGQVVSWRQAPGVVYSINLATGEFEVLHAFDYDDYYQGALVAAPDGFIYGQSRGDGLGGARAGTIFRIDPSIGRFETVYEFGPSAAPRRPHSVIEGSDGGLLATSIFGGTSNLGTVFRLEEGGDVEVVHSFDDGETSSYRVRADLVLGSDGLAYGTRTRGGAEGFGSVFTIDPDGTYDLVHSFDTSVQPAPIAPSGALIESRFEPGTFFGALSYGSGATGGVFEVTGTDVTILAAFDWQTGFSQGRLVQTADGYLFGVVSEFYNNAGWFEYGGLFRASPGGGGGLFRNLAFTEGQDMHAGMVEREAGDGSETFLYGTAPSGGASNNGTIFKFSTASDLSVVHAFSGADGAAPWAEMALAADGNLYGTTRKGGLYGYGTLFAITRADEVVTLHHFDHSGGAWPEGALFVGSDANLYGTTSGGGSNGGGTVFRFNLAPVVVVTEPVEIAEGDATTLTTDAVDPQGGPVTFAWDLNADGDFGDGSGPTVDFVADTAERDGPGVYPVAVRATDSSGVATLSTTTVTVRNIAPEVSVSPSGAETAPGRSLAFEINFVDPGPDAWAAAVDWGDGSTVEIFDPVVSPFQVSHIYQAPGSFTFKVNVADDDDGEGEATASVDVGTVENLIEQLIIDVEELIDDGVINRGRGRSLIAELQVALWFLQWNNGERQAMVRIELFIKKVEIMVKTDQLDPDIGAKLIAKAEVILEMLRP